MLLELALAHFKKTLVGSEEVFEELRRNVDVMTRVLQVAQRRQLAILMHIDHAEDHFLQMLDWNIFFLLFFF